MATPTAAQVLPHIQGPGPYQRLLLRHTIRQQGGGDLTDPIERQIVAMGAACTVDDVTQLMLPSQVAFAAKATIVAQGLVSNEGADQATATSGPFITFITQLLQTLLPMLVACIPAA